MRRVRRVVSRSRRQEEIIGDGQQPLSPRQDVRRAGGVIRRRVTAHAVRDGQHRERIRSRIRPAVETFMDRVVPTGKNGVRQTAHHRMRRHDMNEVDVQPLHGERAERVQDCHRRARRASHVITAQCDVQTRLARLVRRKPDGVGRQRRPAGMARMGRVRAHDDDVAVHLRPPGRPVGLRGRNIRQPAAPPIAQDDGAVTGKTIGPRGRYVRPDRGIRHVHRVAQGRGRLRFLAAQAAADRGRQDQNLVGKTCGCNQNVTNECGYNFFHEKNFCCSTAPFKPARLQARNIWNKGGPFAQSGVAVQFYITDN